MGLSLGVLVYSVLGLQGDRLRFSLVFYFVSCRRSNTRPRAEDRFRSSLVFYSVSCRRSNISPRAEDRFKSSLFFYSVSCRRLMHVLGRRTDDLPNQASQPESRYISVLGVPSGTWSAHHGVPLQEPVLVHVPLHVHLQWL